MPKKIRYVWFDGETIQELKRRLNAVDRPVLRVQGQRAKMTLEVVDLNASPESTPPTVLNEAHTCPPVCL